MVGFMIEDLESGKVRQFHWSDVEGLPRDGSATLLDVRTEGEYRRGHLNGFRNIPLDDLREHLDELDRGKPVYVNCQTGLRSYLACRLLTQYGCTCAHLSGGYSFYQVVTKERQTARSAYPCGMEKLSSGAFRSEIKFRVWVTVWVRAENQRRKNCAAVNKEWATNSDRKWKDSFVIGRLCRLFAKASDTAADTVAPPGYPAYFQAAGRSCPTA